MRATGTLALGLVLAVATPAAAGNVYSWTDKEGVVHLTNKRATRAKPGQRAQQSAADYEEHIAEAAAYYKVPVELIKAVIAAESNFDPGALSEKGAMGLMQLIPNTATEMYVGDPYDPRENIHGGVRYLRTLANMFGGDLVKVVAAYNAGPDAVMKAGGVPRIAETEGYVKKVLKFYYGFKGH